jgi:acyl-coenzyme A thioesterase PaaI-like protein
VRASAPTRHVAQQVAGLLRKAYGLLEPDLWPGPFAVEQLAPPGDGRLTWDTADLRRTVPYSPMLGPLNPLSPAVRCWTVDQVVHGTVTFSPIHAGPIDTVHGGMVAALLDELLAMSTLAKGVVGYTKSIALRYHRPTPLGDELTLWAECAGRSGRHLLATAEVRAGSTVTASAVGTFAAAGEIHQDVYRSSSP